MISHSGRRGRRTGHPQDVHFRLIVAELCGSHQPIDRLFVAVGELARHADRLRPSRKARRRTLWSCSAVTMTMGLSATPRRGVRNLRDDFRAQIHVEGIVIDDDYEQCRSPLTVVRIRRTADGAVRRVAEKS